MQSRYDLLFMISYSLILNQNEEGLNICSFYWSVVVATPSAQFGDYNMPMLAAGRIFF